jgi:hypothetical protein
MHTASQPLLPTSAPLAADAAPLAGPSGTPRWVSTNVIYTKVEIDILYVALSSG